MAVDVNMTDKICLVTGATAGIGKVTAQALAAQGATVILAGRNPQKTAAAVHEIQAITGNPSVDFLIADFSELAQVRQLASDFKRKYSHLDVLVNNAGGYFNTRKETPYGVEMTFLVNHLAPFLLTHSLLDLLSASKPARIVNVASEAHRFDNLDFNDLGFKHFYFGFRAYARSKLANILATYEIDRRYSAQGICANTLHPGHVATNIWRTNFGAFGPFLKRFMQLFSLTPEQGADTVIYLASSPEVDGVSGKYFMRRKTVSSSPISYDLDVARKCWEISEQISNMYPGSIMESP